jgi:hypothetical protein
MKDKKIKQILSGWVSVGSGERAKERRANVVEVFCIHVLK